MKNLEIFILFVAVFVSIQAGRAIEYNGTHDYRKACEGYKAQVSEIDSMAMYLDEVMPKGKGKTVVVSLGDLGL
jgi:hypothetical protein